MLTNTLFMIPLLCFSSLNLSTNISVETNDIQLDKIVFENCSNIMLSLDNEETIENDEYTLTIKLDYDTIMPAEFKNETERISEFARLENYFSFKNANIASQLNFSGFEFVYISKYSPYISIDTNFEELSNNNFSNLLNFTRNENVETIYVNESQKEEPSLYYSYEEMGALDYIVDETYTGEGVTVGILELGIVNKNHANFADADIEVRDLWYRVETISEHTTKVASILVGPQGIAKDCSIKSCQLYGDAVDEIDWLMEKGCALINCSYGDSEPDGKYSSKSAYMDFITYTYKVLFVVASGNLVGEDNYNVANPGLAYNAITVGACNQSGEMANFSNYNVVEGARKPDLVAYGTTLNVQPFGFSYGTSLATAIVTGLVALLMEMESNLVGCPQRVAAALYAACENKSCRSFGNGFDNKSGAGVVNLGNVIEKISAFNTYLYDGSHNQFIVANLNVNEGDIIRFSAHWLAYATGDVDDTAMTDYDIFIFGPTGGLDCEQRQTDNKELIEYRATQSGNHRLIIEKKSQSQIMGYDGLQYVSCNYTVTSAS